MLNSLFTAGHKEAVLSVAFSSDGRQLASGSGGTTVRLWDLNTQTPLFKCKGYKNWVLCIAWSADGKHLISGSKAGELQCWDPLTGKPSGNPLICFAWVVQFQLVGSGYENYASPSSFLSVTWHFYANFATLENENQVPAAISVLF
ncbi:unnamed protein product [Ilex paraguariensis]|uniref:Uncharacterized protein n=1 Tax=Ilex paraguariensis TaxID=185542 RepID=A0ABC8UL27_9AQUA